jgi:hypothetical protein
MYSDLGDLTPFCEKVEALFKQEFGTTEDERPGIVIAFSLSPDYMDVHYITNTSAQNAIKVLVSTAKQFMSKLN